MIAVRFRSIRAAYSVGALFCVLTGNNAAAKSPQVPAYAHIVVVMMENHDYASVIGRTDVAPYINQLASSGALLTNYIAIAHPSQPNYLALYAGSDFDVADDDEYFIFGPVPTLTSILANSGRSFAGYVERANWSHAHNPWLAFTEGESVERDFATFPVADFSALPTISFVIPNLDHDMHDGTVAAADSWLKANLDAYAQWAKTNNSLLVVLWDESESEAPNRVPAIYYGAHVRTGKYGHRSNNYSVLKTLLAGYKLDAPNQASKAEPLDIFEPHR